MRASLLIDGPGLWAYNVELSKVEPTIVGRTRQADIVLPDEKVSSRHAKIAWNKDSKQWQVEDLGSSNGTLVNGARIKEHAVRDGDRLRFGSTEAIFKDKATRTNDDAWDKTVLRMSRHAVALTEAISRKSRDEVVVIPDLHLAPTDEDREMARLQNPGAPSSVIYEEKEFDPARFRAPASQAGDRNVEDLIWVAETFASIIGELAKSTERDKDSLYRSALSRLREILGVENGFLMIPNRETRRWVIEAWIGNNKEWTKYEKEHPVPLTVANDAYRQDIIVSNVYGDGAESVSNSASLLQLRVQSYIAIPLKRQGRKAGLLYFDIRNAMVKFEEKQVQLTSRVGNYLLELESEMG